MSQTDYYSFFGIQASFYPDQDLIREKYYALSKEHHPDVHNQSTEELKKESMRMSTLGNEAFKTLSHFDRNLAYLLQLKGILAAEEKYQLAPDFLMEMMDLNESIMEAKMEENRDELKAAENKIEDLESEFQVELEQMCQSFEESQNESLLATIKDLYYKKKYVKRLWENLDNEDPEL